MMKKQNFRLGELDIQNNQINKLLSIRLFV